MWLNGQIQMDDHAIGRKHRKNTRRKQKEERKTKTGEQENRKKTKPGQETLAKGLTTKEEGENIHASMVPAFAVAATSGPPLPRKMRDRARITHLPTPPIRNGPRFPAQPKGTGSFPMGAQAQGGPARYIRP